MKLQTMVTENKVLLFMKGNKLFPQCGFSNTACRILDAINVPYETVNVLEVQGPPVLLFLPFAPNF